MSAQRASKGRALLYLRDSHGTSDQTPVQYLPGAIAGTKEKELLFDGDEQRVKNMIRRRMSESGDIYLDYGVSGNLTSRPGLDALKRRIQNDSTVSHLYTPHRDRLARPDDVMDALKQEIDIRSEGVTIVFLKGEAPPINKLRRLDVTEIIMPYIEYFQGGNFRTELAQKLILAKVKLAENGFSIGGEAIYGFERWLVRSDGTRVRKLERGEVVKMQSCHVVWLPTADRELRVVRRIVREIVTTPANRIARLLNADGIPSPHAGRSRTIREGTAKGRRIPFSGLWTQTTVRNIATHPLLAAIVESGKRSEGDQQRMTKSGYRDLQDTDLRREKPAVVVNPEDCRIRAPAHYGQPIISAEYHEQIREVLEKRGRHLKGKTRTQDRHPAPLDGRVFDMNCGWPLFRQKRESKLYYSCGLYTQTNAKCCKNNRIDSADAEKLVRDVIRRQLRSPSLHAKIKDRIRAHAEAERLDMGPEKERQSLENELANLKADRVRVNNNMAYARSPEISEAISKVYLSMGEQIETVERELSALPSPVPDHEIEGEVERAMAGMNRLTDEPGEDQAALVRELDTRLYLAFAKYQQGKRPTFRPIGGILAFGKSPPPIPPYEGPTAKPVIKEMIRTGESVRSVPERVPVKSIS